LSNNIDNESESDTEVDDAARMYGKDECYEHEQAETERERAYATPIPAFDEPDCSDQTENAGYERADRSRLEDEPISS
jgi:hypothetical protein